MKPLAPERLANDRCCSYGSREEAHVLMTHHNQQQAFLCTKPQTRCTERPVKPTTWQKSTVLFHIRPLEEQCDIAAQKYQQRLQNLRISLCPRAFTNCGSVQCLSRHEFCLLPLVIYWQKLHSVILHPLSHQNSNKYAEFCPMNVVLL